MVTLVIGGAASGKSEYAERLAESYSNPLFYLATMEAGDEESRERIQKHVLRRTGKGYVTIECPRDLDTVVLETRGTILLDCVGNLVANELFSEVPKGVDEILSGFKALLAQCDNAVIVTNDVFSGGSDYGEETLRYMRVLGLVNQRLAEMADRLVEVTCGVPLVWKGEES